MTYQNIEKLETAASLRIAVNDISENRFLIGFDGFVDQIIHVVDTRKSNDEYTRVETIKEYGSKIISASGKSANIELVTTNEKIGGNGPLMANAVLGIGSKVTLIGLLGYPEISPVFNQLKDQCEVMSCGNPGLTDALEFKDGKLLMGKLDTLKDFSWKQICDVIGEDVFIAMLLNQQLVAVTNWTMLVGLREVIDKIIERIPSNSGLTFFFDLADPEKRLNDEILYLVNQLRTLDKRAKCILGLNLREAEQIFKVLQLTGDIHDSIEGLKELSKQLKQKIGISGIVVHSVLYAGGTVDGDCSAVEGAFCSNPKISTGAGDHFNGGFCSAFMSGISLKSSLLVGVATSGWYVRNDGSSPTLEQTASFLEAWAKGNLASEN